jgi:hypothetical protein
MLSALADRLEEKLIEEMELTDLCQFASCFIEHMGSI